MTTLRSKLLLSLSLFLGTSVAANAGGDLLMPSTDDFKSPVAAYSTNVQMQPQRKIYLRGDIGWSNYDDQETMMDGRYALSSEEIDDTFSFGVGIGRYFSEKIRGDITVDYRVNSEASAFAPAGIPDIPGETITHDVSSLAVLANIYYDFNRSGRISPYVGVGLGFATHWSDSGNVSIGGLSGVEDNSETGVAAAFMTGVALNVRRNWKIDAGYRFLYMDNFETGDVSNSGGGDLGPLKLEGIHVHELRVGARYDFR